MVKGNITTHKEAGVTQPELSRNLEYLYIYGMKQAFMETLRQAFADESMPINWRYIPKDSQASQIAIYRNHPKRVEKIPYLVVKTGRGRIRRIGFDQGFLGEKLSTVEDPEPGGTGEQLVHLHGGVLEMNMEVTIATGDARETDDLTDTVLMIIDLIFRPLFQENNLAFTNIDISGEEEEDEKYGTLFKNKISTKLTSSYVSKVPKALMELISNIQITIGAAIWD